MIGLFLFMTMFFLIFWIGFPDRPGIRTRTAREDALHDQIQQAMNWSPDHFHLDEDGKYRNARGEEAVCMTLEELHEKYGREK